MSNANIKEIKHSEPGALWLGLGLVGFGLLTFVAIFLVSSRHGGLEPNYFGKLVFGSLCFMSGIAYMGIQHFRTIVIDSDNRVVEFQRWFFGATIKFDEISRVAIEKQCAYMTDEWTGCIRVCVYNYQGERVFTVSPIWDEYYAVNLAKAISETAKTRCEDEVGIMP